MEKYSWKTKRMDGLQAIEIGSLKLVIEGRVEGKNHRGRRQTLEQVQQITKDQGCDSYVSEEENR